MNPALHVSDQRTIVRDLFAHPRKLTPLYQPLPERQEFALVFEPRVPVRPNLELVQRDQYPRSDHDDTFIFPSDLFFLSRFPIDVITHWPALCLATDWQSVNIFASILYIIFGKVMTILPLTA